MRAAHKAGKRRGGAGRGGAGRGSGGGHSRAWLPAAPAAAAWGPFSAPLAACRGARGGGRPPAWLRRGASQAWWGGRSGSSGRLVRCGLAAVAYGTRTHPRPPADVHGNVVPHGLDGIVLVHHHVSLLADAGGVAGGAGVLCHLLGRGRRQRALQRCRRRVWVQPHCWQRGRGCCVLASHPLLARVLQLLQKVGGLRRAPAWAREGGAPLGDVRRSWGRCWPHRAAMPLLTRPTQDVEHLTARRRGGGCAARAVDASAFGQRTFISSLTPSITSSAASVASGPDRPPPATNLRPDLTRLILSFSRAHSRRSGSQGRCCLFYRPV